MRNLFLMALFGLFMFAGITTQQDGVTGYLSAPAFAGEHESDNKDSGGDSKDSGGDDGSKDSGSDDGSKDSGSDDQSSNDSNSDDQASSDDTAEFHCPEGIASCYRSDGTLYDDPNNLPATAAGPGTSGTGLSISPSHTRSF